MDPNYLLQLDYREHHHNDHSGYRHTYPSSFSSDDPQFWPYSSYPAQQPNPHHPRYPAQCDPHQADPVGPFVCDAGSLPPDDVAASNTRLGIFDIAAMHPQITSAESWGPPHNEAVVPFDEQVTLAASSLAQANPYYPVPVPTPPWIHPSPPSDVTPPTSNSPSSTLANYAGVLPSPSPAAESLSNTAFIDARAQDVSEDASETAAQSPPAVTRNASGTGRRPGACSRCKKLKMRCAFGSDSRTCIRCAAGSHPCIVEGRKARTPGQRENLLRQIREKNETISLLLNQLRNTNLTTPISINAARIPLSAAERERHGEVLSWMERRHAVSTQASEKACVAYDTSQLEDEDMYSSSEDEDENYEDAQEKAVARMRGDASAFFSPVIAALPEQGTLGFLAAFSSQFNRSPSPLGADVFGIANKRYFQPSPYTDLNLRRIVVEREAVPEILISGLISPQEARDLFDLFFEHINPYLSLLDEAIHNAASVMRRCPFLFTVVCALSSRYYTKRPGLYALAIHFAKASAASAFIDGWKCVEMCQAYLMLTAYTPPTQRFEDNRSGFYSGIATRLALELGLNRNTNNVRTLDERHERELLNRRRTWMICSIVDGSTSLETGTSPGVGKDEELKSNASRWCSASKYQHPFDADLPAIIELLSIMHRFSEAMRNVGFEKKSRALDRLITTFDRDLQTSLANTTVQPNSRRAGRDLAGKHRLGMVLFLYQYCRIIIHSFGHKAEIKDSAPLTKPSTYVATCMDASFALLNLWLNYMHSTGHVPYAPDFFFVGTGFAGAFLLELLSPHTAPTLSVEQRAQIINVCKVVVEKLRAAAADDAHAPYSYAVFLESALQKAVLDPPMPAPTARLAGN